MFDTNVFDAILSEDISLDAIKEHYEIFVTHIQRDEIEAITKPDKQEKKIQLLKYFKELDNQNLPTESSVLETSRLGNAKLSKMPTESAVYGVSRWGEAKWTSEESLIEILRKGNLKHTEDALIGETAIKNNLILVTNDPRLMKKVISLGGKAITFDQLKNGNIQ